MEMIRKKGSLEMFRKLVSRQGVQSYKVEK